jgi:hypothetical protein
MYDGFWTVVFRAGNVSAGGVVALLDGKVLGGDSQYFYSGAYRKEGENFSAKLRVQAFVTGAVAVFGMPLSFFDLDVVGILRDGEGSAVGTMAALPGVQLHMKLVKRG